MFITYPSDKVDRLRRQSLSGRTEYMGQIVPAGLFPLCYLPPFTSAGFTSIILPDLPPRLV
eukprot:25927-Eustigmatos_ZCMA.PRE.1